MSKTIFIYLVTKNIKAIFVKNAINNIVQKKHYPTVLHNGAPDWPNFNPLLRPSSTFTHKSMVNDELARFSVQPITGPVVQVAVYPLAALKRAKGVKKIKPK